MKIGLGIGIPNNRASVGSSGPSFPEISDLVLRLESDLEVTTSGADVTGWADQSASENDFDGTGHAPQLVGDVLNGLPAIRLNGTTQYMTGANVVSGDQNRTFFCVSSSNSDTSSNHIFTDGVSAANGELIRITPEYAVRVTGGASGWDAANTSTPAIFTFQLDGDGTIDMTARKNGATLGVASQTQQLLNTDSSGSTIGARRTAVATVDNFFDGDIFAIIAYSRALSTAEIEQVEQYLATKYGITLA